MKTKRAWVLPVLAAPFMMISAAFAANGGREDNSPLAIWIFLGFCALIVVAQVLPAILNARRAARLEKERKVRVRVKAGE